MAPLESRHATDPLAGNPAPRAERAIVAMQPAAAIAHEQSAGDNGDELAERSNAVLQRHPLNRPRERDYSVSPTTMTCRRRGPWAPRIRVCSMSAERDGPVIQLTVRGMAPAPKRSRSFRHSVS